MPQPLIILFDGTCNFCNATVQFVIKNNKKANIKFAPLQSVAAQNLLLQYNLPTQNLNSFVFIEGATAHQSSTGAIRVCKYLNGAWPLMLVFLAIPAFLRNPIYNFVATNRYKWFGKTEHCMVPTAAIKHRFL
jgi:predicted DCC family thiol-disulfide oxidoreductase YuxK